MPSLHPILTSAPRLRPAELCFITHRETHSCSHHQALLLRCMTQTRMQRWMATFNRSTTAQGRSFSWRAIPRSPITTGGQSPVLAGERTLAPQIFCLAGQTASAHSQTKQMIPTRLRRNSGFVQNGALSWGRGSPSPGLLLRLSSRVVMLQPFHLLGPVSVSQTWSTILEGPGPTEPASNTRSRSTLLPRLRGKPPTHKERSASRLPRCAG
mmetsp:Transcript_24876/g.59091  ORF Transcript_24876/g.59091 Transcript_24876/m.59091 type:complete len:211 (-) Transcript_24876:1538-2170(-)